MSLVELPLALALVAGAVAALNPCGFALLPAYLLMLVGETPGGRAASVQDQVWRAARFSLAMTAGFVVVFGVVGVLIARLSLSIDRYLPVVTLLMGAGLILLGAWALLRGGKVPGIGALARVGHAPTQTLRSQVLYGVGFAAASLSCTIGPFLAVSAAAARAGSAGGVLLTFVVYALGMGAVVGALAMTVALARGSAVARLRRAGPVLDRVGAGLLLLAGAYVAWYGWFELRVLAGGTAQDPIVGAATRLQSELTRFVAGLGSGALSGLAVAVLLGVASLAWSSRRRDRVSSS